MRDLLKLELKCRNTRGTKNDKIGYLINKLKNKPLNNIENVHVQNHVKGHKNVITQSISETETSQYAKIKNCNMGPEENILLLH